MRKTKFNIMLALALASLPVCAAWTDAPQETTDRYVGGDPISTYAVERVEYVSKTIVQDIYTDGDAPEYYALGSDLSNGCGAVAGAVVVGFYDKYYSNMVPDWQSYYTASGLYRHNDTAHVGVFMRDLYARMNTNSLGAGVSEDEFKSGLKSYINDKGYNVSYDSLGRNGSFDYATFKMAVQNNQVSVLLVQPSYLYEIGLGTECDLISSIYVNGNHIIVAFGYLEINYVLESGTRHDVYLRVISGWSQPSMAFYKVGSYVDAAYKVTVS